MNYVTKYILIFIIQLFVIITTIGLVGLSIETFKLLYNSEDLIVESKILIYFSLVSLLVTMIDFIFHVQFKTIIGNIKNDLSSDTDA